MSETSKHNPNQTPQVSPEQQRAFRGVYSTLMKLTSEKGKPVMVKATDVAGDAVAGFSTRTADVSLIPGEEHVDNARKRGMRVDNNGNQTMAWATMLDEHAAQDMGVLGGVEINEAGGSHPADIYKLSPDQRVLHTRRIWVYGPEDDPTNEEYPGGHEEVEELGWLTAEEMEDLQAKLETVEG